MKAVGFVARGLVVAALIGCSGSPESTAQPNDSPPAPQSSSALATAPPSVAPSPTDAPLASLPPTPTPSQSRTNPPLSPSAQAGPRWELLVDRVPEGIANVVGFDEGYVGYGFGLELWFSVDGAVWERSPLPPHQPQCEDEELEVLEKAITDGHSVILLGAYTTAECELQTFAWFSNNGRSWQFGSIGEPRQFSEAKPVDAWAIPGGWEAAIANYQPADPASDATAIWQSPDGKSWTQTAIVAGFGSVDGAADAGGNRLLSVTGHITTVFGPPASQERLVASVDGLTWTEVGVEFNRSGDVAVVSAIEPPNGGRSEWVLFVDEFEEQVSSDDSFTGGTLWLSSDLSRWETVMPPKARTYPRAVTSEGLIATACNRLWEECATYSTSGGREWTAIAGGPEPAAFAWIADGPAGVLAATEAGAVYRLVP